jgi:hypothetical protein
MKHAAKRLGEVAVALRLRCGRVHRAPPCVRIDRLEHDPHEVVGVDPGDVLASARHRPANPELEGREHLGERSAVAVKHHSGAHPHDTHPEALGGDCLGLPCVARLCEEVDAAGRLLVDRLVAVGAVVADRRSADEHGGSLVLAQRGEPLHEMPRADHTALADRPHGFHRPALRDALARQVHHRVASGQGGDRGRFAHRVPARRLDRPREAVERGRRSRRCLQTASRTLWVARENRHIVPTRPQCRHHLWADQTRRSCDRHPHPGPCGPFRAVSWRSCAARPSRSAYRSGRSQPPARRARCRSHAPARRRPPRPPGQRRG